MTTIDPRARRYTINPFDVWAFCVTDDRADKKSFEPIEVTAFGKTMSVPNGYYILYNPKRNDVFPLHPSLFEESYSLRELTVDDVRELLPRWKVGTVVDDVLPFDHPQYNLTYQIALEGDRIIAALFLSDEMHAKGFHDYIIVSASKRENKEALDRLVDLAHNYEQEAVNAGIVPATRPSVYPQFLSLTKVDDRYIYVSASGRKYRLMALMLEEE